MEGNETLGELSASDRHYMRRALELARQGAGAVHPNPMVGAVVVREGTIVGEGWHVRFGEAHAEVNALVAAGPAARGSTLYVSLEPCAHQGKTPPCTDAIAAAGVARVVAAVADPNPIVSGRGAERLRESGIRVDLGLEEEAAREIDPGYFLHHRLGRPLIRVKIASTLDGRIAATGGESRWITAESARREVHRMRSEVDAVVVGSGTVDRDDPSLTVRLVEGRNPVRVVVDGRGRLDRGRRVFRDGEARTIHVTLPGAKSPAAEQWAIDAGEDGKIDLVHLARRAAEEGWRDLLVEGGAELVTGFLRRGLVDRLYLFIAPLVLGSQGSLDWAGALGPRSLASALRFELRHAERCGPDVLAVWQSEPSVAGSVRDHVAGSDLVAG